MIKKAIIMAVWNLVRYRTRSLLTGISIALGTTARQPREPNAASQENNTVKDLADEAKEDVALAIIGDDQPVTLDSQEEAARMQECEYCGHYPRGCGG